jgi:hypothetical protein
VDLNGWNAGRLDDLASDVEDIKRTLVTMQSEEMLRLRGRVRELEGRSGSILIALGGPILAVLLTVLIEHVH